jgi:tRNA G10  N-methylase Trm11
VTDPPWGQFSQIDNLQDFYIKMLREFYRVLKIGGIAVVLNGNRELFEELVTAKNIGYKFDMVMEYKILVSGKKASIYKLIKV